MATLTAPLIPDITDSMRAQSLGFNYGNQVRQNALARSAGQMAAGGDMGGAANALLAGGELEAGFGIQDRVRKMARDADEQALLKSQRANDLIFRLASVADTPEKWSMATGKLKQMGVDIAGYEDFNSRDMALARFGETKDVLGSVLQERNARNIGQALMPQQGAQGGQRSVVDLIEGVESGGDPNAKNPLSSAMGAGQFIASTWLATLKKARPDIAAGRSDQELLALRSNRELSREMIGAYAQENGQALQGAGLEASPGNVRLAHFSGAGGAVALLRADPNTPAVQVLGRAAVQANPFLAKMTAGDVVAWANRQMAGPSQGAPTRTAAQPGQRPGGLNFQAGTQAALQAGDLGTALKLQELGRPAKGSFEFTKYGIGNKDTGDLQPYADGFAGDPETKITDITAMRKEASSNTNVKKFDDAIGSYQSMLVSANSDNATSDLDMIYGLAKIMDPESVVREGEFETVRNSSSIPNQIKGYWEFLLKGKGKLDAATRQEILGIASNRLNAYRGEATKSMDRYRSIAEKQRIDPSLVVRDIPEVPQHKPKQDMTPDQIKDKYRLKYGIQP